MNKFLNYSLHTLMSCLVSIFILATSVIIILNFKPLYYTFLQKGKINNVYQLSVQQIQENYDTLVEYNMSCGKKDFHLPHLPYSPDGARHFKEVKDIFGLFKLALVSSFFSLVFLSFLFKKHLKEKYYFIGGGSVVLGVISLLSLFLVTSFSELFVFFHKIAFQNDLWLFDYRTDPIIYYLPEGFFLVCAVGIAILMISLSLISIFSYYFFKRRRQT